MGKAGKHRDAKGFAQGHTGSKWSDRVGYKPELQDSFLWLPRLHGFRVLAGTKAGSQLWGLPMTYFMPPSLDYASEASAARTDLRFHPAFATLLYFSRDV